MAKKGVTERKKQKSRSVLKKRSNINDDLKHVKKTTCALRKKRQCGEYKSLKSKRVDQKHKRININGTVENKGKKGKKGKNIKKENKKTEDIEIVETDKYIKRKKSTINETVIYSDEDNQTEEEFVSDENFDIDEKIDIGEEEEEDDDEGDENDGNDNFFMPRNRKKKTIEKEKSSKKEQKIKKTKEEIIREEKKREKKRQRKKKKSQLLYVDANNCDEELEKELYLHAIDGFNKYGKMLLVYKESDNNQSEEKTKKSKQFYI